MITDALIFSILCEETQESDDMGSDNLRTYSKLFDEYSNKVLPTLGAAEREAVEQLLELQFLTCTDSDCIGFARGLKVGMSLNRLKERKTCDIMNEWNENCRKPYDMCKEYIEILDKYLENVQRKGVVNI